MPSKQYEIKFVCINSSGKAIDSKSGQASPEPTTWFVEVEQRPLEQEVDSLVKAINRVAKCNVLAADDSGALVVFSWHPTENRFCKVQDLHAVVASIQSGNISKYSNVVEDERTATIALGVELPEAAVVRGSSAASLQVSPAATNDSKPGSSGGSAFNNNRDNSATSSLVPGSTVRDADAAERRSQSTAGEGMKRNIKAKRKPDHDPVTETMKQWTDQLFAQVAETGEFLLVSDKGFWGFAADLQVACLMATVPGMTRAKARERVRRYLASKNSTLKKWLKDPEEHKKQLKMRMDDAQQWVSRFGGYRDNGTAPSMQMLIELGVPKEVLKYFATQCPKYFPAPDKAGNALRSVAAEGRSPLLSDVASSAAAQASATASASLVPPPQSAEDEAVAEMTRRAEQRDAEAKQQQRARAKAARQQDAAETAECIEVDALLSAAGMASDEDQEDDDVVVAEPAPKKHKGPAAASAGLNSTAKLPVPALQPLKPSKKHKNGQAKNANKAPTPSASAGQVQCDQPVSIEDQAPRKSASGRILIPRKLD